MKTFMDLELWVYSSMGKSISARNGYSVATSNIYAVLGSRHTFKIITSRTVGVITIATGSYGRRCEEALDRANYLINNPDQILLKLIGTKDKRTKEYKKFVEQVDDFKVWLMTKILKEEN